MTKHEFPELGYAYDALEPFIDRKTMEIHHSMHHRAYFDKFTTAIKGHAELENKSVEEILTNLSAVPEGIRTAVRNNGGGHYHHSFFWPILKKGVKPGGEVAEAMRKKFGSFETFKEEFAKAASSVFGSGWTWLAVNGKGGLEIVSTPNQDSPLSMGLKPVLGIDVWEHAYYLKYMNRRPGYIEAFFSVINWDKVNEHFRDAMNKLHGGQRP